MVDQIEQSVDVIVPLKMDEEDANENDDDDDDAKIIDISVYKIKEGDRPLYKITRNKYLPMIQQEFNARHRLLLKAYDTYAYYSCEMTEMKQKVYEHMIRTCAYSFIMEYNERTRHRIAQTLDYRNRGIKKKLNHFFYYQSITCTQLKAMTVKRSRIKVDYLYFLTDTHKDNVPFYPMINCHHSPTIHISRYLSQLLQPIYDRVTHSNTFISGVDAIDAVEQYVKKGHLRSNTLFVTVHIHDLCTIFPHEQTIEALQRFLSVNVADGHIQGITIKTILELVRLHLHRQEFLYERKLYRMIKGGSSRSPIIILLANIYLYYWQQPFVNRLEDKNEVFGRCFDEIFLTWNESPESLQTWLNSTHRQYPDIRTTLLVNQTINYLDAHISHIDGHLHINVAHDLNTEPYSLPFVYGHARHDYWMLIRAALLRAVGCCATVSDFHHERRDIEFSFSFNGFEANFIARRVELFFNEFNAIELNSQYDQTLYDHLRERVIKYHQHQRLARISSSEEVITHQP